MSQRGGGGRGRASRGRATQKPSGSTPQEQHILPHAQASTSSGAVRRPGVQTVIHTYTREMKYIMKY